MFCNEFKPAGNAVGPLVCFALRMSEGLPGLKPDRYNIKKIYHSLRRKENNDKNRSAWVEVELQHLAVTVMHCFQSGAEEE